MDTTRSFGKAAWEIRSMFKKILSGAMSVPPSEYIPREYALHKYERSLMQSFFEKWNPADKIATQTTINIILTKIVLFK